MADIIGSASLVLRADLDQLRQDLGAARRLVESTNAGIARAQRGAVSGGARSTINADVTASQKLLNLQDRINRLRVRGVAEAERFQQRLNRIQNLGNNGNFPEGRVARETALLNRRVRASEVIANNERRITQEQEKQAAASRRNAVSSPINGGVNFPGSPGFLAAQRRADERALTRRNGAIGSALIGGFFPLLFGQGAGSAVGGFAGGALGPRFLGPNGGFAGGVVGTAIGAQFDAALQRFNALGQGLSDPIKNFQALSDAALLSSRSVERNVESLIAAGRAEEAAAVARADLARLGSGNEIKQLTAAQDELRRSWTELSIGIASLLSGPLAAFLSLVNRTLRGNPAGGNTGQGQGAAAIAGALPGGSPLAAFASLGRFGNALSRFRNPQNPAALERQRAAISARATEQNNAEYRAALAAAQGYNKLALARENEASVIRERNRLRDPSIQGDEKLPQRLAIVKEEQDLRRKNNLELIRIGREEEREQKQREQRKKQEAQQTEAANARRRAEVAREQQDRLNASRDELRLAQRLAGTRGLSRDVVSTQNDVLGAAQARQRAFGALRAAENGGAASVDIAKLRADFQIAGDNLNKAIIEGGDRLVELSREAAKNLSNATLAASAAELGVRTANTGLAATRSSADGIGRFLDPFANLALQNNTLRNVIPTFRRNLASFNRTVVAAGADPNNTFTADLRNRADSFARGDFNDPVRVSELLRDVLDFNRTVEQDQGAQQARDAAQLQLIEATTNLNQAIRDNATAQGALATNLGALATATTELAGKDWTVVVQPPLATPGGFGIQ